MSTSLVRRGAKVRNGLFPGERIKEIASTSVSSAETNRTRCLSHARVVHCNGTRRVVNPKARRKHGLFNPANIDGHEELFKEKEYRPSVREYFQVGAMTGESVEQTAQKIVDLKVNNGLVLAEDTDEDPFYVLSQLMDFMKLRQTHESFDVFIERTTNQGSASDKDVADAVSEHSRAMNLVDLVSGAQVSSRQDDDIKDLKNDLGMYNDSRPLMMKPVARRPVMKKSKRRKKTYEDRYIDEELEEESRVEIEKTLSERAQVESEEQSNFSEMESGQEISDEAPLDPNACKIEDRLQAVSSLSLHEVFQGSVTRCADFGAMVSFIKDGVVIDGICYLPDLLPEDDEVYVSHPQDILSLGDKINVAVVDIHQATGRVRLCRFDERNNIPESLAENDGEIEIVEKIASSLSSSSKVKEIEIGLCLKQYQKRGISLQILIQSEEICGGYEVLVRANGLQQRVFILADTNSLSRKDVGIIIKESLD